MALAQRASQSHDQRMDDEGADSAAPDHAALFSTLAVDALLATGRSITILPAAPSDLAAMREFYDSLSDTAAYYRFLGLRPALVDEDLRNSVEQSCQHVCLLARMEGQLIGIGEFSAGGPDRTEAAVSIAVADDHHYEGVATLLLERLVDLARRCHLERFVARTMRGNEEMRRVLRTLGLPAHVVHDDGTVTYSLDLSSYDEMQRQSAARLEQALRAASHQLRPPSPGDAPR